MRKVEYAIEYAKKGWAVFPLKVQDKIPAIPKNHGKPVYSNGKVVDYEGGFYEATTNVDLINQWWDSERKVHTYKYIDKDSQEEKEGTWKSNPNYNIGIATGNKSNGLIVIDIDINHEVGKYGDETFEEWMSENGCYIDSLTAVTGSGGKHLFFYSNKPFRSAAGYMDDIDIRADGGYIVAPGSIHPNGQEYFFDDEEQEVVCVQNDSDVEFFLNEYFAKKKNKSLVQNKNTSEVPEKITKDRNNYLVSMQGTLAGMNLFTKEEIQAQIKAINQERCVPPLSEDELERTIFKSTASWVEKAKEEKQIKPEEKEPSNKKFRKLKRVNDFLKEDIPDLIQFIGINKEVPLLVEGTCILSAKPKTGKSWFALGICEAVTSGKKIFGYESKKCSALYLDLETGASLEQKRFKKYLKDLEEFSNDFYVERNDENDENLVDLNLKDGALIEQLEDYLKQDPNIGVIIIDVFEKIRTEKGKQESDYTHAYRDITPLNNFAHNHHISLILVHHDRKGTDDNDSFSNILGSTGLQGAVDQMIVMNRKTKNGPIHIEAKGKTIDGLPEIDVEFGKSGKLELVDNVQMANKKASYKNEAVYKGAKLLALEESSWKGSCSQFVRKCKEYGLDIELPHDEKGETDFRGIGKLFNDEIFRCSLMEENVELKVTNPNSGGGKLYRITALTASKGFTTVSENDEDPFK